MLNRRNAKPPKYRHHKARNLAKVTIDRRDIYLGKYNSPESWRQYAEVIADWTAGHAADEIAAEPRSNTNATDIVSSRDQFLCMAFSQLIFCDSLRDIETDLRAMPSKLYHAGFRSRMAQGTLADATRRRDWRIGRDLAESLISRVLISAYGRFLLLSPGG